MDPSITQSSASNDSVTSTPDATPARYTCYDTGTFLALYIALATSGTVELARDAFEQSENVSKAHPTIEVTDAHVKLATRHSRKVKRGTGEDEAEEKTDGMRYRIGKWLQEIMRDLKAE